MVWWILAVLLLFFVQTLLPPTIRYRAHAGEDLQDAIRENLGPRDERRPMPVKGQRAQRALVNLAEALPIFLALAILAVVLGADSTLALAGAGVFFVARVVYVPCYVLGTYGIRTLVWIVGHAGLLMMAIAVAWHAAA